MTQLSGNQFEDDLTVGMEENNAFSTDSIDLFGIAGDDESPIARLKSIILSIDWEISDEILKQLDDELLDLGEVWAGDKIKQVYVQGLSKIGKYIFKEKAGAHPDAIKLLLTFYHNLEKVVLDKDLGGNEKKQLLLSDVRKFDQLKGLIGKSTETPSSSPAVETIEHESVAATGGFGEDAEDVKEIKGLKAYVLGIDWEINDLELEKLGAEVTRLEGVFATNRPKLILLQGIGALSAYINKMRSKSSGKAFVLIHSFYDVLEKISGNTLSASEEKQLLLAEVSKFKEFKVEITTQQSGDTSAVAGKPNLTAEQNIPVSSPPIVQEELPASMSVPETITEGAVASDEVDVSDDVSSRLSSVFGDDDFDGSEYGDSDKSKALEGVNVETDADDDSDEDALPFDGETIAPALAEMDEDSSFSVERLANDLSVAPPTVAPQAIVGDDIPVEAEDDALDIEDLDEAEEKASILQGIDVETEADDDSDEDSLPVTDGALAPALSGADNEGGFDADNFSSEFDEVSSDAIENRLGDFFDDEVATSLESWSAEKGDEILEADDETPGDEEGLIAELSDAFDDSEGDEVEGNTQILATDAENTIEVGDENPENEESLVVALSEIEDDVADTIEEEVGTEDDNLDDGEGLVATLSQFDDEDDVADTIEEEVGAGDDNLDDGEGLVAAPSQFDDEDDVTDTIEEEVGTEDENLDDEEDLVAALSQFDDEDDVADTIEEEVGAGDENLDDEEDLVAALSQFDDEDDVADTIEEEVGTEDENLDDGEGLVAALSQFDDEAIAFEVESDDIVDDDEIEFTVPGTEITDTLIISDDKTEKEDQLIEFNVPGEGSVLHFDEEDSSDEMVFEAVGDDVPLDLLPGEEFDDSKSLATGPDITDNQDDIQFLAADRDETVNEHCEEVGRYSTNNYESLAIMCAALQENVKVEIVQDVFVELNKLRSSKETHYTDKTFLQLLSTVCQYIEKNETNEHAISLMKDIVSGLEMCGNEDISFDNVQEALFSCTSRLLILQRQEINSLELVLESDLSKAPEEDLLIDSGQEDVDFVQDEPDSETISLEATDDDEQLTSFVQKELADIRKLFVEEIENLRKEMSDKYGNIE